MPFELSSRSGTSPSSRSRSTECRCSFSGCRSTVIINQRFENKFFLESFFLFMNSRNFVVNLVPTFRPGLEATIFLNTPLQVLEASSHAEVMFTPATESISSLGGKEKD